MSKKKISAEAQAILSASDAGLYATTVSLVQKFLDSNPDNLRAWLDLGRSLGQLFRYEEAEKAFLKMIELSGDHPDGFVYGEIGNLYRSQGDFESATSWYQKQIDAEPGDAVGHLYLGNLMLRQGNFDAAEAAFLEALNCETACFEEIHYSLGLVYRGQGEFAKAKAHFEVAIEIDDKFSLAKNGLKDVKSVMSL